MGQSVKDFLAVCAFFAMLFGVPACVLAVTGAKIPGGRMGDCDIWAKERQCVCKKEPAYE